MIKPYYQDDYCTIYNGDCRDIIPLLNQKFDLLLTDPPYGTELLGGGYGRRQNHSINGKAGRTIANDKDLTVATLGIQEALKLISTGYVGMFCAARKMFEAVDHGKRNNATSGQRPTKKGDWNRVRGTLLRDCGQTTPARGASV